MNATKKIILGIAAAGAIISASAQEASRSAYFLDGYTFRHELNPAFAGEFNYVSMPALANINAGLFSNVGVNTFLYKTPAGSPYKLTSFMSPTVSADEFLGKLSNVNHINTNVDLTILSAGFRAFKGFNTITIGVHADAGVALPKDFFRFMKLGQTGEDTHYNFSDIKANASARAEVALGHSHKITDKLNIGAKVKVLVGIGNVSAHMTDMDVRMSNDRWLISANGKVEMAAGSGLYVPTKAESGEDYKVPADADLIDWGGIDYENFGVAGYGLGFDLGATYQLLPDLQLSAAVADLGFMTWKHAYIGRTGGGTWEFDGFHDIAVDENDPAYDDNKLGEQLDRTWDQLQDVINIHREEVHTNYTKALNATIRLGAEYKMPFYKNLTGAFLFSTYIAGCQSWTEGRFYANVKPTKWFDATINYGASNYGSSFGWMLNFHPRGFNFFIGSDHQFFKVTPQYVPVGHATANINLGMSFTFGSRKN